MTNNEEKTVKMFGKYMTPRDAKRAKYGAIIGGALALILIMFNGGFGGSETSSKELKRVAEVLVLQDQHFPENTTFKRKQKVKRLNDTNWRVTGSLHSQNADGRYMDAQYTLGIMYDSTDNMFYTTFLDYSY